MMTSGEVISGYYDPWLVALSVLIGVIGGYCTIELAERVTASRKRARLYWWIGGSIAMAIGTWSMHYTGMLALRLLIPVLYDWPTSFLSYLASLSASLMGLFVVSRRTMGFGRAFAASILVGGGIAALHYTAMTSMRLKAMHHYSSPMVTLSVLAAVAFSLLSLWLMFLFREDTIRYTWRKFGSALLLGGAISVMHYTGMAAVTFTSSDLLPDLSHAVSISNLAVAGIGADNVMLVVVVLLTALADRLQEQTVLLRRFSQQLVEAQELERRHLARELHDEIGQALTAARINLQSVMDVVGAPIGARLRETVAILDQLLGQVRQISLDLRPSMLDDLGLVPALRSLLGEQGRRASVEVEFSAENIPETLDPEIQTACFRIAQEAITNVVRHAGAKNLTVELRRAGDALFLVVQDDGIGFDAAKVEERGETSLGLMGIKERVALAGGRARIISSPGEGTRVEVGLPLHFTHNPRR
jgi:signal transduction histidine kinase